MFTDEFTPDDFDELAVYHFGPEADSLTVTDVLESGLLESFVEQVLQQRANP